MGRANMTPPLGKMSEKKGLGKIGLNVIKSYFYRLWWPLYPEVTYF